MELTRLQVLGKAYQTLGLGNLRRVSRDYSNNPSRLTKRVMFSSCKLLGKILTLDLASEDWTVVSEISMHRQA